MIMPTKIIQPVDSLFVVSSYVLKELKNHSLNLDELLEKINEGYYKKITIEKIILAIDFLYLIGEIRSNGETIKIEL